MGAKNTKNAKLKEYVEVRREAEKGAGTEASPSKCPVKLFKQRSTRLVSRCWSSKCGLSCFTSAEASPSSSTVVSASSPVKSNECPFKPRSPCADLEAAGAHDKAALLNGHSPTKCPFKDDSPPSAIKKSSESRAHGSKVEFLDEHGATSKTGQISASSSCSSLAEFYDFSENEKKLISFSFELIKQDLNTVGVIAFMKSFETLPTMKDSFDSFKNMSLDQLSTSHALRTHSQKVMKVIGDFVTKIFSNETDQLKAKLIGLGSRHCIYGAKKEFLIIIENQFIHSIKPIIIKGLRQPGARVTVEPLLTPDYTRISPVSSMDQPSVEDKPLSEEEIGNALNVIEEQWHNVFRSIRKCMMTGIVERK